MEKTIPYGEPNRPLLYLHPLLYFPIWWYYNTFLWFLGLIKRAVLYLEDRIAILLTLRLLFRPIFQDYSLVGRVLGPIFRTLRILAGLYVVASAVFFLSLFLILWLTLPIMAVLSLLQFPTFRSAAIFSWPIIILTFTGYYLVSLRRPKQRIDTNRDPRDLNLVTTRKGQNLLAKKTNCYRLLQKLLETKEMTKLYLKLGIDTATLEGFLDEELKEISLERENLINTAYHYALETNSPYVDLGQIFLALVEVCEPLFENLRREDLDMEILKETVRWIEEEKRYYHPKTIIDSDYTLKTKGGVNRSWNARPTPSLDRHSQDLTKKAQQGRIGPIVGKKEVISEIIKILSRKTKHNPLLLGEPGSGKTTTILGIAEEIIAGPQARALWDKRLVSLDIASLTAGARNRGEINEKITTIIKEIENSGNVILFIDEIHNLVESAEETDIATIFTALIPHLEEEKFKVIGATSYPEYRKHIEPNEAFSRLFEIVEIEEASEEETAEILKYLSFSLENEYKVTISYPAIASAINLSKKLVHDRVLPDKAVDLLDAAAVEVSQKRGPGGVVLSEDVAKAASEKIHVPVGKITEEESEKLLKLEDFLHKRIVDQDEAIKAMSDALRRARTEISDEKRPRGSLLFVGPTGVGKTEMAKAIAETYFGNEKNMVRLDMSEYKEGESINRLLGAPPGKGSGEGQLTEAIRRRPFTLILLDELEKANPNILDIFLQVLDDGRLTDNKGRVVDFTNTIIIGTSNAGANLILQAIQSGKTMQDIKNELMMILQQKFKPEFLNRFDGIIFCKALSVTEVREIAKLMTKKVEKRLEKQDIKLEFTQDLISELARQGYTPELGARPLRRLIQDKIEARLAKDILSKKIQKGMVVELDSDILGTDV